MREKLRRPCQVCGSGDGICYHEAIAKHMLGILKVFGNRGLPSCVDHDVALNQGDKSSLFISGVSEVVPPGTDLSMIPLSLIHRIMPWRHPKSPRNRNKSR